MATETRRAGIRLGLATVAALATAGVARAQAPAPTVTIALPTNVGVNGSTGSSSSSVSITVPIGTPQNYTVTASVQVQAPIAGGGNVTIPVPLPGATNYRGDAAFQQDWVTTRGEIIAAIKKYIKDHAADLSPADVAALRNVISQVQSGNYAGLQATGFTITTTFYGPVQVPPARPTMISTTQPASPPRPLV